MTLAAASGGPHAGAVQGGRAVVVQDVILSRTIKRPHPDGQEHAVDGSGTAPGPGCGGSGSDSVHVVGGVALRTWRGSPKTSPAAPVVRAAGYGVPTPQAGSGRSG